MIDVHAYYCDVQSLIDDQENQHKDCLYMVENGYEFIINHLRLFECKIKDKASFEKPIFVRYIGTKYKAKYDYEYLQINLK